MEVKPPVPVLEAGAIQREITTTVFSPHPLLASAGRQLYRAEFLPGESLHDYLIRLGVPVGKIPLSISINGRRLPPGMWKQTFPKPGVIVNVRAVVQKGGGGGGKNPIATILSIGLMVVAGPLGGALAGSMGLGTAFTVFGQAVTWGSIIGGAIMVAGTMLINNAFAPHPTNQPLSNLGGQFNEPSPTYSISGGQNRARPFAPMPLVIGQHRMFPDLGAKPFTEYEGDDQYLYQIMHFGLSDVVLSDYRIGNTPVSEYDGVTIQESGADGALSLFPGNVDSTAGGDLTYETGWITRTSGAGATALAVEVSGALFYVGDGGYVALTVDIEVEYSVAGAGSWQKPTLVADTSPVVTGAGGAPTAGVVRLPQWQIDQQSGAPVGSIRITNDSRKPVRRTYRWSVPSGQYDVRVRRITTTYVDTRASAELSWTQLRTYQPDTGDYTGQKRVALKIKASGQINGAVQQFSALASAKAGVYDPYLLCPGTAGNYAETPDSIYAVPSQNWCAHSENMAGWTDISGVTVTSNAYADPSGNMTIDTLTDDSAAAYEGKSLTVTVPNDSSVWRVAALVRKDMAATHRAGFNLALSGGTAVNVNARFALDGTNAASCTVTSYDANFWLVEATITNNTTGNVTLAVQFYPATSTTKNGGDNVAATGSMSVGWVRFQRSGRALPYYKTTGTINKGQFEIEIDMAADDYTPAAYQEIVSKKPAGTEYILRLNTTGTLSVYWGTAAGVNDAITSAALSSLANGERRKFKVQVNSCNASNQKELKVFTSVDNGASWQQFGSTVTGTSSYMYFESGNPLRLGFRSAGAGLFDGNIYSFKFRPQIDGAVTVDFNLQRDALAGETGFTSASTGEAWSILQSGSPSAEIVANWTAKETSNPAWWVRWFANGKTIGGRRAFGASLADSRLDIDSIRDFAKWCDDSGLTVNAVIDRQMNCAEVLNSIALLGRGQCSWATGKLGVVWDAPNLPVTAMFGPMNIKAGTFAVEYISEKLADEIVVGFINPDLEWQMDYVRAPVPGVVSPSSPATVELFGCTDKDQAGRHANLSAAQQFYRRRRITWQTALEGLVVNRGDVVQLSHDMTAWAQSGRIVSGTTTVLNLDKPVRFSVGQTHYATIRKPDGSMSTHEVQTAVGEQSTITLLTALSQSPDADPNGHPPYDYVWFFDPSLTPGKRVKIIDVEPVDEITVTLTATDDPADYYLSESNTYTYIEPTVSGTQYPVLSGLEVSEELILVGTTWAVRLRFTWETSGPYSYAVIRGAIGAEGLQEKARTADRRAEIIVPVTGIFNYEITGYSADGKWSGTSRLAGSHTIAGKDYPPGNVTGFAAEHTAAGTVLSWNAVGDIDLSRYEVRQGASWAAGTPFYEDSGIKTPARFLPVGATTFWVAALDTSGNYSASPAMLVVNVTAPAAPAPLAGVSGANYTLSWNAPASTYPIKNYVIKQGGSWVGGVLVAQVDTTKHIGVADWSGSADFWVAAVDVNGVEGTPATVNLNITVPAAPTVSTRFTGQNVEVSWTSPASLLPVTEYEVRYGTDFANGTYVNRVKGNSLTVKADWLGTRTYWVAAINSAGTTGTAGSAAATVTAIGAPSVSQSVIALKAQLSWTTPSGTLPLIEYEIRHGASFAAGTPVARTQSNTYRVPIDWTGSRTFWVAAVDSAGNYGTGGSVDVSVAAPDAPAVSSALAGQNYSLSWTVPASTLPVAYYDVRHGASFGAGTPLGRINGTTFAGLVDWGGSRTFWVAAVDENGNVGTAGSVSQTINAPSQPSISAEVVDNNAMLRWNDAKQSLPIQHYEVYRGVTFGGAELIGTVSGRFSTVIESAGGSYTYWVRGIDTAGNAGTQGSVTATVNQPPDYVLYNEKDSHLDSPGITNAVVVRNTQYALEMNGSTQYGSVASVPDLDSGITGLTMECWVAPDFSQANQGFIEKTIGGNVNKSALLFGNFSGGGGTLYGRVVIGAALYTASSSVPVSDDKAWKHVLMRWDSANGVQVAINGVTGTAVAAAGSLDQGAGALKFGQLGTGATAYSLFGKLGPCRIYKRRITDAEVGEHYRGIYKDNTALVGAWNMSDGSGAVVADDTDNSYDMALSASPSWVTTLLDGRIDPTETNALIYPVDHNETWDEWFTGLGYTTFDDFINAGYTNYLTPAKTTGQYAEVIDYGVTIAATKITVNMDGENIVGSVTVTPKISVKNAWGDAWTDYPGVWSVFVTQFRYVKVTLDFSGAGGNNLRRSFLLHVKLDVKLVNDAGTVNCVAGDAGGTVVTFNVDFVDVNSITVTPKGTSPVIATYDFTDAPNPTEFKVLLFDRATGARVSGEASWSVKGV